MRYVDNLADLDLDKEYNYADYLMWRFKERVEIIKGKIMAMSPAPVRFHQKISGKLHFELYRVFINQGCELYSAPFDVRLTTKSGKTSVVQPDLCVICDKSKLDDKGCNGSPELVVEILSESNRQRDLQIKFDLYEECGVLEYWIVDPISRCVTIYPLENAKFQLTRPLFEGQIAQSTLFPELQIPVEEIFKD